MDHPVEQDGYLFDPTLLAKLARYARELATDRSEETGEGVEDER